MQIHAKTGFLERDRIESGYISHEDKERINRLSAVNNNDWNLQNMDGLLLTLDLDPPVDPEMLHNSSFFCILTSNGDTRSMEKSQYFVTEA